MAAPATGGRRVHPRFTVNAGAAPFLADCGIPLRDNPALRNDNQRWELLMRRVVQPLVADLHDPAGAVALLLLGYRPNTHKSYMSKCRSFFRYCATHHRSPLPASTETMIGYMLFELQRAALVPPSLSKYLSAVASLHQLAGHADPM